MDILFDLGQIFFVAILDYLWSATLKGQDMLIHASYSWTNDDINLLGLTCLGQCRFGPIWPKHCGGPKCVWHQGLGARNQEKPKGGGPEGCGAQNLKGGARGVESPKVGGARGVGSPTFRAFFPLPPLFSLFFLSLGVFSWNFGGV